MTAAALASCVCHVQAQSAAVGTRASDPYQSEPANSGVGGSHDDGSVESFQRSASHFTAINFGWDVANSTDILQSVPSIAWGRRGGGEIFAGDEAPFQSRLTHLQFGDEQNLTDPGRVQETANGLAAWRAAYPHALGFADQNGLLVSAETLRNYHYNATAVRAGCNISNARCECPTSAIAFGGLWRATAGPRRCDVEFVLGYAPSIRFADADPLCSAPTCRSTHRWRCAPGRP